MKQSEPKKPIPPKKPLPQKKGKPSKNDVVGVGSENKVNNKLAAASKRVVFTLSKYTGKIVTYALNIVLTLLLIGIITGSSMACALVVYIKNYVDPVYDIDNLKYDSSLTTSIYYQDTAADGKTQWVEWEEERLYGTENRMWVSYEEMPDDLINAFVSIEDKRFFTHDGIDIRRTTGAVLGFLSGNDSYGGSTITQQLIKNVTGEDDVTIQRKIQEILRALNLESKRSKQEILEMYLNTIYLAKGCYGVSAAAYQYFGKEVSELTLVECASLASIPQNPSRWNPVSNPELNEERRWTVLEEMYKNTDIEKTYTLEEIRAAQEETLVLKQGSEKQSGSTVHSWFVDTLIFDVIEDLQKTYNYDEQTAKNLLYSGGLQIYCTIDRDIQAKLDAIYQNDANFPSQGSGVQVESAMTIMDHNNGHVVAIVGGRGVKDTPLGFNRATMAERQPGSSIKPLSAYSIAIEKGLINYSSIIDDTPFTFDKNKSSYWPNNWNHVYEGLVTVGESVRESKNTSAVKVVDMVGLKTSYDFLTNKYRLSTLVKEDTDYAPLALGGLTNGVYNRDICAAYAAIANNGVYNAPKTYTKVLDSSGNVILDGAAKTCEVILSEDTCAVTTKLLQEVVNSSAGTGYSGITIRKKIDVAGKTGTTTNNKDLYFCGYTPYYTAACWAGYDTPKTLSNFTSGQTRVSAATYLWNITMDAVHEDILAAGKVKTFADDLTKNLITKTYCKDSGLLIGPYCNLDIRGKRGATGYYTLSNLPASTCNCHVEVSYCADTNCVAGPGCTNVKTVALVDHKRSYPISLKVTDAQYTYVSIADDVLRPSNAAYAYYTYTIPNGEYAPTSGTSKAANAFCATHNPTMCTS
ncbi:MAG: PBP1A family penicillin-binding protein [Clostridia bacterium]|nr:PBP1A family penicillin-binding protein [Clostridia bacterium]